MVRFKGAKSTARTAEQTPNSIQEALWMYLQPIKNDDPRLDFYTLYKREAMEYDTNYIRRYSGDLDTTLIFVGFRCLQHRAAMLTTLLGRSVFRGQFCLRHRSPVETRAWTVGSSASTDPFLPAKIPPLPRCGVVPPQRSSPPQTFCMRACSCRCSLGLSQAVVESVHQTCRQIDGRTAVAAIANANLMASKNGRSIYSPHHAPGRPPPPCLRPVAVRVVGRHVRCTPRHLLHCSRRSHLHWDCDPWNILVRVSLPNTGVDTAPRIAGKLVSAQSHLIHWHVTAGNTQKLLVNLSPPKAASLIYATWADTRLGFISASHRVRNAMQHPLSLEVSLSHITSGIQGAATKVRHQIIHYPSPDGSNFQERETETGPTDPKV